MAIARPFPRLYRVSALVLACVGVAAATAPAQASAAKSFVGPFNNVATLASTVPSNGDVNPYGVAVVPNSVGSLTAGDVLVSNFNNSNNLQGTGSTIDEISPDGIVTVFATLDPTTLPGSCPGGVGLTTALVALRSGIVIVGSLPTSDGTSATMQAGCLIVIDSSGNPVETIFGAPINGPWDMTAFDGGSTATLFVTNVLNGTVAARGMTVNKGTVLRIELRIRHGDQPSVASIRTIATGFAEHTDPDALVVGPTGVGLGRAGVLYVADSNGNRIAAIPHAMTRRSVIGGGGMTVSSMGSLNDPLGLAIAPNGDVVTMNGGDGKVVETSPSGHQVATKTLVADGAGDLFGLAVAPRGKGIFFVNDAGSGSAANSLQLQH